MQTTGTRWRLLAAAGALVLGLGMSASHASPAIDGLSGPDIADQVIQVADASGAGDASSHADTHSKHGHGKHGHGSPGDENGDSVEGPTADDSGASASAEGSASVSDGALDASSSAGSQASMSDGQSAAGADATSNAAASGESPTADGSSSADISGGGLSGSSDSTASGSVAGQGSVDAGTSANASLSQDGVDTRASSNASATADNGTSDPTVAESAAKARSFSTTRSFTTPHGVFSVTRSVSVIRDEEGNRAVARSMSRAFAIDTPGVQKTVAKTRTKVKTWGEAEGAAMAGASAEIEDDGSMSATTYGETSVSIP